MYVFFAHAINDVLQLIVKVTVFSFQSYCFHKHPLRRNRRVCNFSPTSQKEKHIQQSIRRNRRVCHCRSVELKVSGHKKKTEVSARRKLGPPAGTSKVVAR